MTRGHGWPGGRQLRTAGWAAFDALLYDQAMHHFGRALEMATRAGNHYCAAIALKYAGMVAIEHGHPTTG